MIKGFPVCSILWNKDGGVGETRTLAPGFSRPTPLAGAPRHQLEYFSECVDPGAVIGRAGYAIVRGYGGEEGIRTLGSFESPVFKTGSLNHSDTSPKQLSDSFIITHRLAFVKYFFNFFSKFLVLTVLTFSSTAWLLYHILLTLSRSFLSFFQTFLS